MMERKYEMLKNDKIMVGNVSLYRIIAIRNFGDVKKGDIGGYIEKEENLSHEGLCWVYDNAWVYGDALVSGDARVYGSARVYGNAIVSDNACV